MADIGNVARPFELLARGANSLQSVFVLATRWYVSWQFLKSGWIKVTSWQSTLELFRDEYHVPLLPPYAAAVTGAFGELFFSTLVILGIGGRIAPRGRRPSWPEPDCARPPYLVSSGFGAFSAGVRSKMPKISRRKPGVSALIGLIEMVGPNQRVKALPEVAVIGLGRLLIEQSAAPAPTKP